MPTPPLIALSATSRRETPDDSERVRLNAAYVTALTRAGAAVVILPPQDPALASAALGAVDALVLTGGEDLDPSLFGATPHPALGRVTGERDHWELALVHAAHARALPTLAICRGIQVVNVALGGTLVQDIPSELPDALAHDPDADRDVRTHPVAIASGSRLAGICGRTAEVNSLHHQAVALIADGLRVVGTAPDGIIEAAESPPGDPWWMIGVQWHPEELDGPDARLFDALVAEARRPRR